MKAYYYIFYSFIVYSFFGWIIEVIFHLYKDKKFINRGFLFGPVCPIYGVSAVFFIVFLSRFNNIIFIFLGGAVLASAIEIVTGYLMEVMFNAKWWDYSNEKFNIKGYVCLKFSFIWGALAVFFIKFLNPLISKIVYYFIENFGESLYSFIFGGFIVDIVLTLNSLIAFRSFFKELQDILLEIKSNVDNLKENLAFDVKEKIEERIDNLNGLKERLIGRINKRHIYLMKAYPHMKSKKFDLAIDDIKKRFEKYFNI
ncbi:putative ABC transporter permease [Caloramator sp. E03]|uniref:putative ABC transporter permease n=1 Tax=Caloramator sp. E03 TaxID=2576307 RepID=UPI00143D912F|nr:putative ABC transporter permease [Caloramator sp. E03]